MFDSGAEHDDDAGSASCARRVGLLAEDILMRAGILALVGFLLLLHRPAARNAAVEKLPGRDGRFVGLANYVRYFSTPTLVASLWNSLGVALLSTAIVVPLAFFTPMG